MEDHLILQMPEYRPVYRDDETYGFKKTREREALKRVLTEAAEEYCMYCYRRLIVSGNYYGNLEHAIEKNNSQLLEECIPNIGIACSNCNESLKRVGEKKRRLSVDAIEEFQKEADCSRAMYKQCRIPCRHLKRLQRKYNEKPDGHIILQPMGVKGAASGESLRIQYDILAGEFQPDSNAAYTDEEKDFIWDHIQQFQLNDSEDSREQLLYYIKMIIDTGGKLPEYEYNNYIVKLFAEKIEKYSTEKRVRICKVLNVALNVAV